MVLWPSLPNPVLPIYLDLPLRKIDRDLNAALNIKAVGLYRVGLPLEATAL